ncbi:ATP-binding protein [Marinilabiliaceae bacterium JC040]|nr:ATP-binding protein [Marinilabiliaceae bacterium JC040]
MLIEFKYKNFQSFKNETKFLMTSVKAFKEHIDTNVIKTDREFDLLKTAAVYGSNSTGKTNFILAMAVMKRIIHNCFSDSLKMNEDRARYDFQFKLNTETEKANTMYEASFLVGDSIYRYGFEINGFEIKKEWLYKKIEREISLFRREGNKYIINKESFKEGVKYQKDVNNNVLFLSYLAQNNKEVSRFVFDCFADINVLNGLYDNYASFTLKLLKSDLKFNKWLSLALSYMEITNIEAGEVDGKIITYHNKYDGNNLLIESVPFIALKEESAGTTKLIHLLGPIYDTLRKGRILFIDEFDSRLHTNLSRKIVELFNKYNKNGAQLILAGQDTTLLDRKLFRRDQIWFVDKDQFGISELYSLSDFDAKVVRNNTAYNKKYLDNIFGAAGTIDFTNEFINLLYE